MNGWCHPSQALASALATVAKARRALKVAANMMDAYAGAVPRASKKDRLVESVQDECVALSRELMKFLLVSARKREVPKLRAHVAATPPREVVTKETCIPVVSKPMVNPRLGFPIIALIAFALACVCAAYFRQGGERIRHPAFVATLCVIEVVGFALIFGCLHKATVKRLLTCLTVLLHCGYCVKETPAPLCIRGCFHRLGAGSAWRVAKELAQIGGQQSSSLSRPSCRGTSQRLQPY